MEKQKDIVRKANIHFFAKMAVNALLIVLGALFITFFLRHMQQQASLSKQRQTSMVALEEVVSVLEENAEDAADIVRIFHKGNQDMVDDLKELIDGGVFTSAVFSERETSSDILKDMMERSGVNYLFILRDNGHVQLAPSPELNGTDLVQAGMLTPENLTLLCRGTEQEDATIVPVLEDNDYGYFYFYSSRISYGNSDSVLVLAVEAAELDIQLDLLQNIGFTLSHASVGNNGYLFAMNPEDGTFVYYDDEVDVMTGRPIAEAGLTPDILQDGYTGVQDIIHDLCYCVCKAAGDGTIICFGAELKDIFENDNLVLYWSVIGFVLVMLLCLAYAIIVRNDFIRHATETKKIFLPWTNGDTIIFDKSIFRKVFPLMVIGVLLIFAISFYTQTLLEISDGVEKSVIALEDITVRYREGQDDREQIESNYANRFLSKARLIAYLLEEDPSVLNEPSDRQYFVYDEAGNRDYLTDDEGNILTSVSSSARLQELCEENDLSSIYIFNEDGRTIATSTPNWFFTLSHNEEDQSHAFLQVLEGKTDSLIQEERISDLGGHAQFIGVAFRYYTTTDEEGNTVYLSRREYERRETLEDVPPVTAHHSLLQVSLLEKLSRQVLNSTDIGYIFSSNMLEEGFVMLFDADSEHRCLYSPDEESIGMTAEEIGLSRNAFHPGDYYGFTRISGETYFLYCRYVDGSYIATAIPESSMYHSRVRIAAVTALTSLLLLLFLSFTVTLTTREEEHLYATASEEQEQRGLNAAMFSIILPSGRRTSTTKAAARWDNRHIKWDEKSPEQKLTVLLSIAVGILLVYIALAALGVRTRFGDQSVIRYIVNGDWDRGANIFAFSACALVLIFTAIVVSFFSIPVRILTSLLGTRSETVGHLLLSFVRYGGALCAIFYSLYLIGFDASGLLASAGILSLIIGLGAQSLIKDILAGIFMVFEGEFRVGDIVTIDSFRGTVMDIGLRTTKVLGIDGNVKIFNNSEISGVLNMTKEASYAASTISIEYGQDIEYVEAVLKHDLPLLQERNPRILDGPTYLGVSALGESGVSLLVIAQCYEKDIKGVSRYLNREILKIFYENGINVPFPNVTISNLETQHRKTIADYREPQQREGLDRLIKSQSVVVTSYGEGMDEALHLTEQFGSEHGLERRPVLHLRLLTEELIGMMRGIAGGAEATYWIGIRKQCYELHLSSDLMLTREMREQLLSVSTSGENEASKGFMGKIREMIFTQMLPSSGIKASSFRDGGRTSSSDLYTYNDICEWSMNQYKSDVSIRRFGDTDAEEAWDELEKSIVARLADDVKVSMNGISVEITIYKSFPD